MTSPLTRTQSSQAPAAQQQHVKGTLLQSVVQGLRALYGEEDRAPAALESRLSKPAFELLDETTIGVRWYPVELYCELVELFWELAGDRDPEFIRAAGRASAQAMIESGIYRAYIETGQRASGSDLERALRRVRVTVGVTHMLYDFVEVDVEHDATIDEVTLTYRNVASFTDAVFYGTQGFLDAFSAEVGVLRGDLRADEIPWRADRPTRDRFVYSLFLEPSA